MAGVCVSTSALKASLLWEFPKKAAPPMIPTIKIKMANTAPPPAINAANTAFTAWVAASAIAFSPLAVVLAVLALCLAAWENNPWLHMAHPNGRVCGAKRPKCEAERSHHL